MERTKYIDHRFGVFYDRLLAEPPTMRSEYPAVDVVMLTLDADNFLHRCLCSLYREVPVNRLLVCDGGSKDSTKAIFQDYPRVLFFARPDIRTMGKAYEFLFNQVETEWCVIIDADLELQEDGFDKMCQKRQELDVMECGERTLVYHFARDFPSAKLDTTRPGDSCYLARTKALSSFHCDDDYIWRITDFFFRQQVEKAGFKYGKVPVRRFHHETERVPYTSDEEKIYQKMVCPEPQWIIIDKNKLEAIMMKYAMGIVKYLDPAFPLVKLDSAFDSVILRLDRNWVAENGPAWLPRYDREVSWLRKGRKKLRSFVGKIVRMIR